MYKSSSFRPLHTGYLSKPTGYDSKGNAVYGVETPARFSIVKYKQVVEPTSIRTDKSGSKSRAEEQTYDIQLMVDPKVKISANGRYRVFNNTYRVIKVFPRYDMAGMLHHHQVDLMICL